jgi:hypothetical protein
VVGAVESPTSSAGSSRRRNVLSKRWRRDIDRQPRDHRQRTSPRRHRIWADLDKMKSLLTRWEPIRYRAGPSHEKASQKI